MVLLWLLDEIIHVIYHILIFPFILAGWREAAQWIHTTVRPIHLGCKEKGIWLYNEITSEDDR
jgi:hypothetical protein